MHMTKIVPSTTDLQSLLRSDIDLRQTNRKSIWAVSSKNPALVTNNTLREK